MTGAVDFFSELRELAAVAGIAEPQASRLCELISQRMGGSRPYIKRRAVEVEIRPSDTPSAVSRRYGVPRSTAHRWVTGWKT